MIVCSASEGDHRPLRLVVEIGEQLPQLALGEKQAVGLVVCTVDRHAHVMEQGARGDDYLRIAPAHPVVGNHRRLDARPPQ